MSCFWRPQYLAHALTILCVFLHFCFHWAHVVIVAVMQFPVDVIQYLGTKSRRENPSISNSTLLHTYGQGMVMAEFSTDEEVHAWTGAIMSIKGRIESINASHEGAARRGALSNVWIPMTADFINTYGPELVPVDIRAAINDVRKHLDMAILDWPPVLVACADGNGGLRVRVPELVDSLGRALVEGDD